LLITTTEVHWCWQAIASVVMAQSLGYNMCVHYFTLLLKA